MTTEERRTHVAERIAGIKVLRRNELVQRIEKANGLIGELRAGHPNPRRHLLFIDTLLQEGVKLSKLNLSETEYNDYNNCRKSERIYLDRIIPTDEYSRDTMLAVFDTLSSFGASELKLYFGKHPTLAPMLERFINESLLSFQADIDSGITTPRYTRHKVVNSSVSNYLHFVKRLPAILTLLAQKVRKRILKETAQGRKKNLNTVGILILEYIQHVAQNSPHHHEDAPNMLHGFLGRHNLKTLKIDGKPINIARALKAAQKIRDREKLKLTFQAMHNLQTSPLATFEEFEKKFCDIELIDIFIRDLCKAPKLFGISLEELGTSEDGMKTLIANLYAELAYLFLNSRIYNPNYHDHEEKLMKWWKLANP